MKTENASIKYKIHGYGDRILLVRYIWLISLSLKVRVPGLHHFEGLQQTMSDVRNRFGGFQQSGDVLGKNTTLSKLCYFMFFGCYMVEYIIVLVDHNCQAKKQNKHNSKG